MLIKYYFKSLVVQYIKEEIFFGTIINSQYKYKDIYKDGGIITIDINRLVLHV